MIKTLYIQVHKQGLHAFTPQLEVIVDQAEINEGICNLFIQHTSASLLVQENYDPSAKVDLENWLNRLVPERDPLYTHTTEGDDDMPAHIKASLTACSLSIPIMDGKLALGTWQGVYLWEHRRSANVRKIIVHVSE